MHSKSTTTRKWIPFRGHYAHFIRRDQMKRRHSCRSAILHAAAPPTVLPVDSSGGATVQCPMDGNDQYGDCGAAMADHVDRLLAWRQGKGVQLNTSVQALVAQYLKVSGGDNGLDETMLVGPQGMWTSAGGGIAGDPARVIVDSLDVPNDTATLQYCIDQLYAVQMAWSVPDRFIQGFTPGASYLTPMTPDPNNGHYTPLADIDPSGNYRLWTWGAWCWTSTAFIDAVDPVFFTVFSAQQFDPATGLDSKGRHITTQAAKWQAIGGKPIPASVIDAFPPIGGPAPNPAPIPVPPTPAPAPPGPSPIPTPWGPLSIQQILMLAFEGVRWAQQIVFEYLHGGQARDAFPPFPRPFPIPVPMPVGPVDSGYHTIQVAAGTSLLDGQRW
jgi:hypothetical protein